MGLSSAKVVAVGASQPLQTQLDTWLRQLDCHLSVLDRREDLAAAIEEKDADLILLAEDPRHPEQAYNLCCQLQQNERTAFVPVMLIVSSEGEFFTRHRAFVAGIVALLKQPLDHEEIPKTIKKGLEISRSWDSLTEDNLVCSMLDICKNSFRNLDQQQHFPNISPLAFTKFKEKLAKHRDHPGTDKDFNNTSCQQLYEAAATIGISSGQVAHQIAEFTGFHYLDGIMPHQLVFGPMPPRFCFQHEVVSFIDQTGQQALVMANPFDWELVELLCKLGYLSGETGCYVTEPENIRKFAHSSQGLLFQETGDDPFASISALEKHPTPVLAEFILDNAVTRRATDIHIEPKIAGSVVRLRVDGDLHDVLFFEKPETAQHLIARFKVLSTMDIAETRRPQDGGMEIQMHNKNYSMRLSTTNTPNGECLKIRILEPEATVRELLALGMSKDHCRQIDGITTKTSGMLLVVGPVGSGKTTTAYSILTHFPWQSKNVISAEDPIEYRIPFVSQHQVNEKSEINYETLLTASVRQDPDILFVGEIRDPVSAQIAMEFASTGRLTLTTLHAINATAALFRLECFGLTRRTLAENIHTIIAQRLLRCLCPSCKKIQPMTECEQEKFAGSTAEVPIEAAYPVGCPNCHHTGYHGRTGVFEIVIVDQKLKKMISRNVSQNEIRQELRKNNVHLMGEHAVDKVRNYLCSPQEVISGVFQEESDSLPTCPTRKLQYAQPGKD